MFNKSIYRLSQWGTVPGMEKYDFAFQSDIANLLLNTNGGRNRRPNFVIFVVWYTLIVGGWVFGGGVGGVEQLKLGQAEIASFVSLVLFKNAGRKVSPRFHLFVSDVNQGNKTLTSRSFYLKCERHFK